MAAWLIDGHLFMVCWRGSNPNFSSSSSASPPPPSHALLQHLFLMRERSFSTLYYRELPCGLTLPPALPAYMCASYLLDCLPVSNGSKYWRWNNIWTIRWRIDRKAEAVVDRQHANVWGTYLYLRQVKPMTSGWWLAGCWRQFVLLVGWQTYTTIFLRMKLLIISE